VCSIAIGQTGDVGDRDVVVLGADDRVVGYQRSPGPAEALSDRVDAGLHVVGREAFDYLPDEPVSDWRRDAIPALLGHDVPVLAVELAP
ncbi:MAG: mannose-phosphate guanylyltransferase, partial [Thermoleophilaceae bacterium]|nr:mannose-phosphate guanylyltransferase [Thermoleophilaceae bacterium]